MVSAVDASEGSELIPNLLGIVAVLLWASTIAFARVVIESLGVIGTPACTYLLAGMLLCGIEAVRSRGVHRFREIPRPCLIVCGFLFVSYMGCFFGALGLACDRRQTVEAGMLNYLWPALVVVFSVPILRYRARPWLLAFGVLIGIAGIACVLGGQAGVSVTTFIEGIRSSPLPYLLGLLAGIIWGLYSNFVRRLSDPKSVSGTPLFMLATGVLFTFLLLFSEDKLKWSPKAAAAVLYLAAFPGAMGYLFWEIGMKKGNVVLLGSLSLFAPVLSTLISCALLRVTFGADLVVGALLVTAGAWICKFSVSRRKTPSGASQTPGQETPTVVRKNEFSP